jgi:hypothetical protein
MRRIVLPTLAISLFLISCSKYQYLKVSSDNMRQGQTNEFIAENDSFRVVYKFNGADGPVEIAIVNKLGIDLQVDWDRSFFIRKEKYRPLYTPSKRRKNKKAEKRGDTDNILEQNEKILRSQSIELVPRRSSLNKESFDLFKKGFLKTGGHKLVRERIRLDGISRKTKKGSFSGNNSPFHFRLLLTLSAQGKPEQSIVVDNSFYISELLFAKISPERLPELEGRIVIQRSTMSGAVLGTIGTIVGTVAAILIEGWIDSLNSDD